LVYGRVVERPYATFRCGSVTSNLSFLLMDWLSSHPRGKAFAAGTGYVLQRSPDLLRAPAVSFVVNDRLPDAKTTGFFDGPPDFAAEVVSPNDRRSDLHEKVKHWLDAGCREVWVVWPETRSITIHRPGEAEARLLHDGDRAEAGDVLDGFAIDVSDVFG
jgi:Uma2 family endonuclease